MSSYVESIFFISSQTSNDINSKKSHLNSLICDNISEDKDKNLFSYIKDLAITNDLPLPNKEKDYGIMNTNNFILEQNNINIDSYEEKIDRNMLNDIFKILSKYSH